MTLSLSFSLSLTHCNGIMVCKLNWKSRQHTKKSIYKREENFRQFYEKKNKGEKSTTAMQGIFWFFTSSQPPKQSRIIFHFPSFLSHYCTYAFVMLLKDTLIHTFLSSTQHNVQLSIKRVSEWERWKINWTNWLVGKQMAHNHVHGGGG